MRRAALLVLLAGLVACSGGGGGLTRAQFIRKGDAICARFLEAGADLDRPTSAGDLEPYLADVLRLADDARTDLAALDPPADGAKAKQALLEALDASMDRARDARDALGRHDLAAVQSAFQDAARGVVRANGTAKAYGFRDCAGL